MRKIGVYLLIIIMIGNASFPSWAVDYTDGLFGYVIDDDEGYITLYDKYKESSLYDIVIPDTLHDVTSTSSAATVVGIETGVFVNKKLASVIFPSDLKEIDDHVFASEYKAYVDPVGPLKEAIDSGEEPLPPADILAMLEEERNIITEIDFPDSLERIGNGAFMGNMLTSVELPDSIRSIGAGSFAYNEIEDLYLPERLYGVNIASFMKNKLTSVELDRFKHVIGEYAFSFNEISDVKLTDNTEIIGAYSFYSNNLEQVELPDHVDQIGEFAFAENNLTSFQLPINALGYNTKWSAYESTSSRWIDEGDGINYELNPIGDKVKELDPGELVENLELAYIKSSTKYYNGYIHRSGTVAYGEKLAINTSEVTNANGDFIYTWYRDDEIIKDAIENEYILVGDDANHIIKCVITNSVDLGQIKIVYDGVFQKEDSLISKGVTPVLNNASYYSVTIMPQDGYEYLIASSGVSPTNDNWQDDVVFSSLSHNTSYDIYQRVKETETHKASDMSNKLTVSTPKKKSKSKSSSSSSSSSNSKNDDSSKSEAKPKVVEEKAEQSIAVKPSVSKTTDGETLAKAALSVSSVRNQVKSVKTQGNIVVDMESGSDDVELDIAMSSMDEMKKKEISLEVKSKKGSYILPSNSIQDEALSELFEEKIDPSKVNIKVKIKESSDETVKIIKDKTKDSGVNLLVTPVSFEVQATYNGETKTIENMNTFVTRMIPLPTDMDVTKITTGVVVDEDGNLRPVPTTIVKVDDMYYAKINSVTNSLYTVMSYTTSCETIRGHWAEDEITSLMNSLVIDSEMQNNYDPSRVITRGQFTELLAKALGLKAEKGSQFTDLDNSMTSEYIYAAYHHGLISGTGIHTFNPNGEITREQAMTILHNVLQLVSVDDVDNVDDESLESINELTSYEDSVTIANYAKTSVAWAVKEKIVSGKTPTLLAPKDNITCAESCVLINRLLNALEL